MTAAQETEFLGHYNRSRPFLYRLCRVHCPDPDDRQDLFGEITYQLWKAYPGFRGEASLSTWMYRIALNTALTYVRKRGRALRPEPLSEQALGLAAPPDSSADEELVGLLYRAIDGLSPVDKAITLLYLEEQSYEQIADITGLTVSNVSVRLVRVRKRLEKQLNEPGAHLQQ